MSCALLAIGRTLNLLLQHLIKKVVAIAEDFFFYISVNTLQCCLNVLVIYISLCILRLENTDYLCRDSSIYLII